MRIITAIALMLVSTLLSAQEREVWACQSIDSIGFRWEDGNWKGTLFNDANILVTLDGENSTLKLEGFDYRVECSQAESFLFPLYWSCSDNTTLFVLNPETGQAGYSSLFGALDPDRASRDTVFTALYQCTKF